MLTRDALARFAPRPAKASAALNWDGYVDAMTSTTIAEAMAAAGITTRQRLRHLLAQWGHESGGFTVLWEDMSYSADRIVEIFGLGHHSAKVGLAEARTLAHNPPALADRVYGIGNPKMAAILGNTEPGDGYANRGFGIGQVTGKADHERLLKGDHTYIAAIKAALTEWVEKGCNALADADNLLGITRKINGGTNGLADRQRCYARALGVWPNEETYAIAQAAIATLKKGMEGPSVLRLQELLVARNYFVGRVDGIYGQRTEDQVLLFQRHHGLKVDGEAGPLTFETLEQAPPRQEREGVTAASMAAGGDAVVSLTGKVKGFLKWLWATLTAFFGIDQVAGFGLVEALIKQGENLSEVAGRASKLLAMLPGPAILIAGGAIGISAVLWIVIDRIEARHVAKAKAGANMGA